jgi:UDP-N-acetylmuramate dehydrogenase
MPWCDGLEPICRTDAPLAPLTWYGLGGAARWLVTPRDEPELAEALRRVVDAKLPWRVLGRGANVLVRDEGFDGVVIRLDGPAWEHVAFSDTIVTAAAGADFPKLVKRSVERGLAGLERLAGIPGTVGGIVRMNAGGKYGNVADVVDSVRVLNTSGVIKPRPIDDIPFGYRTSGLHDCVITAATFRLQRADVDPLRERFQQIWKEKHAAQEPVSTRSAGCIFKNPPQKPAGKLLDELGLKGERRGGATISARHANFIVATPDARAQDVIDLIQHAKDRVQRETGIALELEIDIW